MGRKIYCGFEEMALAIRAEIWYNIRQTYSSKEMRVSVIIPCYNLVSYVDQALESVRIAARHFGGELEVICVDDGSTDGTGGKIDAWRGRFSEIGCVKFMPIHQANGGEGAARNAGLDVATGEWITYLDGDDVWGEWILKAAAELIGDHSTADILDFRFELFEDGTVAGCAQGAKWEEKKCRVHDTRHEITNAVMRGVGVYPTFFRREKFGDERFSGLVLGADRLYVAKCLAKADEVVMDERVMHGYRQRGGSAMNSSWTLAKVESAASYAEASLAVYASCGKRIEKGAFIDFLVEVLLADVPRWLRKVEGGAAGGWAYWMERMEKVDARLMRRRFCVARRILLGFRFSRWLSIGVAAVLRRIGLTRGVKK